MTAMGGVAQIPTNPTTGFTPALSGNTRVSSARRSTPSSTRRNASETYFFTTATAFPQQAE